MILRIEKKSMQRCDECHNAKILACTHAVFKRDHDELTKKQLAEIRQLYNDKNKQTMMQELFS